MENSFQRRFRLIIPSLKGDIQVLLVTELRSVFPDVLYTEVVLGVSVLAFEVEGLNFFKT